MLTICPPLLLLLLLAGLRSPASGLRCYQCEGEGSCNVEECPEAQQSCRTTSLWDEDVSSSVMVKKEEKSCAWAGKPNSSLSYLTGQARITLVENHCTTDLCNGRRHRLGSGPARGGLVCVTCGSSDLSCERNMHRTIHCSPQDQCVDLTSYSVPDESTPDERHIRGCGQLSDCTGPLGFHNNHTFNLLRCCNTSLCNGGPVIHHSLLPKNGVKCRSCWGNRTHGCSHQEEAIISCQGPMDHCLEATGMHEIWGPEAVVMGCATAAWCKSPYLSVYGGLDQVEVHCCSDSLCKHQATPRSRTTSQPHLALSSFLALLVPLALAPSP
ncbi:urokinase plasminogen activator surface receptor isoform X1 [Tachyglossus aculeatus]|uniref:urokinase plasminogen activator surface receptor isoform X1 n=2 Tax=Tachyglossus aculeatus TaxID=9261 RepID=UPI0018F3929D|nr:urokinase plasminogen activator surface receptor isoform X1 [Tachyglossus aculeatus]